MDYGRNSYGFTHFCKPGTGILPGCFRDEQSRFSTRHGTASRLKHKDIVFNELFHHGNMTFVVGNPGVVTPHHSRYSPDPAIDDIIVEWPIRSPK